MKSFKFNWRVNKDIRAPEVRVLDEDGKQIGVMKLGEALNKAQKDGLDLIEIAPTAHPPVVKIIELGKFRYEEEKKAKKAAQKTKASELKEVRFSPFIAENDFHTRLDHIKEFLAEKNKIKVVVVFKGRQMGSKTFGYNVINNILKELGDSVVTDMQPKFLGRHLVTIISPINKRIENAKTENQKITN